MLQIHRILHPTDFSAGARAALGHALHLARRFGAVLDVLHVSPALGADPLRGAFGASLDEEAFYQHLRREADAQMEATLGAFDTGGVEIRRVQARAYAPAPAVLDYAADEDVDLIVLGTHGHRGFREMLLGSVSQEVVRRATCPVLTVPAPDGSPAPGASVARVLAPIDFSASARTALRYAEALAALYAAPLDLLHVVGAPQNPEVYRQAILFDEVRDNAVEAARHALHQLVDGAGAPPAGMACHVQTGYPAREILAFAEAHQTGLIVMATHGLTGLQHFLFGSVSEKVVQRARCPVFVVKSFGKALLAGPETAAEGRAG